MIFSHSSIQTYQTCPKSFEHSYVNKMQLRRKPSYYVVGSAIAKFLELWYRTKDKAIAKLQITNTFKEVDRTGMDEEAIHDLECDKQIALGIAAVYPDFYAHDLDEFETVLTEQQFKFTINGEYKDEYRGFIDILIKDSAGDWWIFETKTAAMSTVDGSYFERVQIDNQCLGYMYGGKTLLGRFPKGIIYNVIKKPAIRLKKGESYDAFQRRIFLEYKKFAEEKRYFLREQIIMSERRVADWLEGMQHVAGSISTQLRIKNRAAFVKNTGACRNNYGTCPWLQACITKAYNQITYTKKEEK